MSGTDPQTHAIADDAIESLPVRAASLDVRSGPDQGAHARLESPRFVIGSGEGADLLLTDKTVSREHVTLALGPAGIVVRDEGSRNGTFLGTTRLREVLLTGDAILRLGNTTVALQIDAGLSDIPIASSRSFGGAIGVSPAMRHVFAILQRASQTDVTILLEGESGVGKEVLARAVHDASPRRAGPFIAVDCGAIPAGLIESELFGHAKGAFTGAMHERVGLVQEAHRGTLFLDEIGELPLDLQPKLLRVLEQREVRPVGGRDVRKVDTRVLAATNRNLAACITEGTFRPDLFYRLSVARVAVPPLRDRLEDIEPIAVMLLRKTLGDPEATLSPQIASVLKSYRWPGNVRELKNVIERHALLGVSDRKGLFDNGEMAKVPIGGELWSLPFQEARRALLDDFEGEYLRRLLERTGGVVVRAAEQSGISRPTMYRMLERLGIKNWRDGD